MKIAMVSSIPAYPTTAGNCERIRTLAAEIVKQGHELHFFFLPPFRTAEFDLEAHERLLGVGRAHRINKRFSDRVRDFIKFGVRDRLAEIRKRFGIGEIYRRGIDDLYSKAFDRVLRDHSNREKFDAVIVEYIFSSAAFDAFSDAKLKILDTHDSFADRHLRFADGDYWFSTFESQQVLAFERADIVIAIQEEEARLFRDQLGKTVPKIETVSHIMPLGDEVKNYASHHATFLGSANPANISAINSFMAETMPLIIAEIPDFKLYLAGSISGAIPDNPAIVKLGRVDRLVEAFELAPISINPVAAGTGINIKLLDSLACGVATVCTETGCRGVPERFLRGILPVPDNDPMAFANAVIALSQSSQKREELGRLAAIDARAWNSDQSRALAEILVA